MSYVMDFESPDKVSPDDQVLTAGAAAGAEGLRLVCDPKSLLFLFGMELDYSSALIGGGFKFKASGGLVRRRLRGTLAWLQPGLSLVCARRRSSQAVQV